MCSRWGCCISVVWSQVQVDISSSNPLELQKYQQNKIANRRPFHHSPRTFLYRKLARSTSCTNVRLLCLLCVVVFTGSHQKERICCLTAQTNPQAKDLILGRLRTVYTTVSPLSFKLFDCCCGGLMVRILCGTSDIRELKPADSTHLNCYMISAKGDHWRPFRHKHWRHKCF
jgi:hypothetical protein